MGDLDDITEAIKKYGDLSYDCIFNSKNMLKYSSVFSAAGAGHR